MLKAKVLAGQAWKAGVGEIDAAGSAALVKPPSANANLYPFVTGVAGARSFDGAAWSTHVGANLLWTSSAWNDSAWSESAWSESAWSESAWSESAWVEGTTTESTWTESAWSESAWVE